MRVLISTSTFPLQRDDGLPRFVYDLAEELARRGEVTVLAPHAPGAAAHERWGALEVERFGYFGGGGRLMGWGAAVLATA
jgi:glycogen synthase